MSLLRLQRHFLFLAPMSCRLVILEINTLRALDATNKFGKTVEID